MMLNGEPTSWQGQSGLNTINSMWLTRMLIKFPRVRLQSLERGIEYTPGLSKMFASGHGAKGAKRTVSGSGYKDFHTRSAHGAEQLPEKARQAKVKLGAAAMAAGGLYGYLGEPDPMMVGLVSSGLGPIALPFAVMAAGGAGLKKGLESDLFTGLRRGVMEGGLEAASAIPQSTETGVRAIASGERFIPGKPFSRLLKLIGAMDDDAAWPLDWTEEQ